MFLNESINNTGVSSETSMYEAIMEASSAYHTLCMKMVKCEHAAIVNENYDMLREAEESFTDKVSRIAKTLYQKFISFLNRIRAEWSKLVAWAASKFAKKKSWEGSLNAIGDLKVKVKAVDIKKAIANVQEKMTEAAKTGADMQNINNVIEGLKTINNELGASASEIKVDATIVRECQNFIKEDRKKMIRELEQMRSCGTSCFKFDEKDKEAKKEDLLIAKYTTLVNKVIARVNFLTIDAVKICRAATNVKNYVKESYLDWY